MSKQEHSPFMDLAASLARSQADALAFPTAEELQAQAERLARALHAAGEAQGYRDPEQRFSVVLADCREADRIEVQIREKQLQSACNMLGRMGTLTINEVQAVLEALMSGCDGDTSINLQQCLENVKADALAIEALNDDLPDPGWRDGPFTTV